MNEEQDGRLPVDVGLVSGTCDVLRARAVVAHGELGERRECLLCAADWPQENGFDDRHEDGCPVVVVTATVAGLRLALADAMGRLRWAIGGWRLPHEEPALTVDGLRLMVSEAIDHLGRYQAILDAADGSEPFVDVIYAAVEQQLAGFALAAADGEVVMDPDRWRPMHDRYDAAIIATQDAARKLSR